MKHISKKIISMHLFFKVYDLLYTLLDWYKRELRGLSAMKNETNGTSQVIRVSASCNITFL